MPGGNKAVKVIASAGDNTSFPLRSTYVLARLTRVVQRLLEEMLTAHGLSLPQFTVLAVLLRRPGLSNAQLARRAYITPQSMQEVLRVLEDRALIRRTPASENQRILRARLTATGKRLAARADSDAAQIEDAMLADLSDARRLQFVNSLRQCVASLGGGLKTPS